MVNLVQLNLDLHIVNEVDLGVVLVRILCRLLFEQSNSVASSPKYRPLPTLYNDTDLAV